MKSAMQGITINDRNATTGALAFDLRDLVRVMGERAQAARWRVTDLECIGGTSAEAFHRACDEARELGGVELAELANSVGQVIDGEFAAFLPGSTEPWVVIRAVDSSAFDVVTNDVEVLTAMRREFSSVAALPM